MLARKSLLIVMMNVLAALVGLATLFFIGRFMTPTSLGMLGFALGLAGFATFLASLGIEGAHVKRVSEGRPLGDCIATFTYLKAGLVLSFAVVVVVAATLWSRLKGFQDATTLPVVFAAVAYYFFFHLRMIPAITFNALSQTGKAQFQVLMENALKLPLVAFVALAYGLLHGTSVPLRAWIQRLLPQGAAMTPADGALYLGLAQAAALFGSLLLGVFLMRSHRFPFGRFDGALARSYWTFALPTAVFQVIGVMATQVDTIMLGYFWSATDVADYYAAQRLNSLILIIPTAAGTLLFPLISQAAARGDREAVGAATERTQRLLSMAMMPAAMFMVVYAREGIHIFLSDAYLSAAPLVRLLAVFSVLVAFTTIAYTVVSGMDRPRTTATIGIVALATNVVLNLAFIPTSILGVPLLGLKGTGAALTTIFAQALALVLLLAAIRRLTGAAHLTPSIGKHVLAAGASGLVLWYTKDLFPFGGVDRVWELGIAGLAGVLLYGLLLVALREMTKEDIEFLRDLSHPGKLARYMWHDVQGKRPPPSATSPPDASHRPVYRRARFRNRR